MAWPFYALVSVNQRARLGPPLGDRVDAYVENIILLLLIAGLLTYVHLRLQPQIDLLFEKSTGNPIPADTAARIGRLRGRRKRIASICLFSVLTMAMFGMQVWVAFPLWLTGVLVLVMAAFTWRAYQSQIPYGWV